MATAAAAYIAGDAAAAQREWEDVLPRVHFENRRCGLSAAKVLVIASAWTRAPIAPLRPSTVEQLVDLARRKQARVFDWAR